MLEKLSDSYQGVGKTKIENRKPTDFLPLRRSHAIVLALLVEGPTYGYGIMQRLDSLTGRRNSIPAFTINSSLYWCLDHGLSERFEDPDEFKRKYFIATEFGRQVLMAEREENKAIGKLYDLVLKEEGGEANSK